MIEPPAEPSSPKPPTSSPARKWLGCLLAALALVVWLAPEGMANRPRAGVGTSASQCANAPDGIGDCVTGGGDTGWINGNLNVRVTHKALYREGDFVPFRVEITGLAAGQTYTLGIGYDAVEKSLHTYDYLGTYNGSENWPGPPPQQVVPCGGIGDTAGPHACGNAPSVLAVPEDTHTTFPDGSHPPPNPATTSRPGEPPSGVPHMTPAIPRRSARTIPARSSARSTSPTPRTAPRPSLPGAGTSPASSTGARETRSRAEEGLGPRSTCAWPPAAIKNSPSTSAESPRRRD